jgi:ketosteroid isomerase-like protein
MSRGNVEIVREIYREAAEGRLTTCLHLFHPDVEYTRVGSGLGLEGTWRGVEAMVRKASEWALTFDLLRVQAERFIDAGDAVVVFTRQTGNAKASGVPVHGEFTDVMTLREGRVVRFCQYQYREEALEAVGLRE